MARREESFLDLLTLLPWWVSVIFAGIAYGSLQFYFPSLETENILAKALGQIGPQAAPFVVILFLFPAVVSYYKSLRKKKLLDDQKDITSIRSLPWKQFEELVGEAFRRRGYSVLENEVAGADGGVDLWLRKDGNRYLVQCKQWKAQKVGVSVVREMYGLVSAHQAAGAIVITSGMFTQEARDFAQDKNIDLIEGQQLYSMINAVKERYVGKDEQGPSVPPASQTHVICPSCGSDMKLRTAKRGANAGQRFWGCVSYPRCKRTRKFEK